MSILAEPRDLPESGLLPACGRGKQHVLLFLSLTVWGTKRPNVECLGMEDYIGSKV